MFQNKVKLEALQQHFLGQENFLLTINSGIIVILEQFIYLLLLYLFIASCLCQVVNNY
jgi:hypothetical protein